MALRDPYERDAVVQAMAELVIAQSHKKRLSRLSGRRAMRQADQYRLARQEDRDRLQYQSSGSSRLRGQVG